MNDTVSLDTLSAKQCECLELVLQHLTSKQIALELGISPFTVNQRLDAARQRLGATTRHEAAIMYAKLKGIPQSLAYHTLAHGGNPPLSVPNIDSLPDHLTYEPFMLGNQQEEPLSVPVSAEDPKLTFAEAPFPAFGARKQDPLPNLMGIGLAQSGIVSRLFLVFGMTIFIMMMILVAVAAGQGITKILHSA